MKLIVSIPEGISQTKSIVTVSNFAIHPIPSKGLGKPYHGVSLIDLDHSKSYDLGSFDSKEESQYFSKLLWVTMFLNKTEETIFLQISHFQKMTQEFTKLIQEEILEKAATCNLTEAQQRMIENIKEGKNIFTFHPYLKEVLNLRDLSPVINF